jgi:hypothetical protein
MTRRFWKKCEAEGFSCLVHRYTFWWTRQENPHVDEDNLPTMMTVSRFKCVLWRRFWNKCEAKESFYPCLVYTIPSKSVYISKSTLPHVRLHGRKIFFRYSHDYLLLMMTISRFTRAHATTFLEQMSIPPSTSVYIESQKQYSPTFVFMEERIGRPNSLYKCASTTCSLECLLILVIVLW